MEGIYPWRTPKHEDSNVGPPLDQQGVNFCPNLQTIKKVAFSFIPSPAVWDVQQRRWQRPARVSHDGVIPNRGLKKPVKGSAALGCTGDGDPYKRRLSKSALDDLTNPAVFSRVTWSTADFFWFAKWQGGRGRVPIAYRLVGPVRVTHQLHREFCALLTWNLLFLASKTGFVPDRWHTPGSTNMAGTWDMNPLKYGIFYWKWWYSIDYVGLPGYMS